MTNRSALHFLFVPTPAVVRRFIGGGITDRGSFFQLVFLACAANGLATKAIDSIARRGIGNAFLSSFDISGIVWAAVIAGIVLSGRREADEPLERTDRLVGWVAILLAAAPVAHAGWLGLIGACAWRIHRSTSGSDARRGARILLLVTMPMFWSRLLFSFAGETVLSADAAVTGWILGTPVSKNLVRFASGDGYFQIYPACSSLVNMALALLGWWTIANLVRSIDLYRTAAFAALLALAVFAINISRLVAIGAFPQHFDLLHGDIGNTVVGGVTFLVMCAIAYVGIRTGRK